MRHVELDQRRTAREARVMAESVDRSNSIALQSAGRAQTAIRPRTTRVE